jgi:hypothetical protein
MPFCGNMYLVWQVTWSMPAATLLPLLTYCRSTWGMLIDILLLMLVLPCLAGHTSVITWGMPTAILLLILYCMACYTSVWSSVRHAHIISAAHFNLNGRSHQCAHAGRAHRHFTAHDILYGRSHQCIYVGHAHSHSAAPVQAQGSHPGGSVGPGKITNRNHVVG